MNEKEWGELRKLLYQRVKHEVQEGDLDTARKAMEQLTHWRQQFGGDGSGNG